MPEVPVPQRPTDPQLLAGDAHVVFLVNFVAPNLVAVLKEVAKRVGRLTVLSSVEMEANRQWEMDAGGLDVIVQKTWTITRTVKHPGGYEEHNYIHVPLDSLSQLRRLDPDAIVSLELGARTFFSSLHRTLSRTCAHVVAVYASERSEAGRGGIRRFVRRRLLRRADWVTQNGPSCERLLLSLGATTQNMSAWNYASDPEKAFLGERLESWSGDSGRGEAIRILTVGQLAARKGVVQAMEQLGLWARQNPERRVQWNLVGSGPLESQLRGQQMPENVELILHGHCDPDEIRQHYGANDVMLFPTLGDEWGLVVDEALFSGLAVIGSCHSQAATTLLQSGVNGYLYDPEFIESLGLALSRYVTLTPEQRQEMSQRARLSVRGRTPQASADQFVLAVGNAIARRRGLPISPSVDLQSDLQSETPVRSTSLQSSGSRS
ncbi:glycosyltransferase family 4 protein [Stieleria varia]|uniref:Glycosyl transferases group 1 n=1 Tax=Stieleria varia TaxID=2528005 RepID=A0A5C6AWT9_9BACT|nr:glycosyltransferase family 4 protein [Stieleria varia]TWU04403.1 Glycosyl transferases group 1 [Stieleria varia]